MCIHADLFGRPFTKETVAAAIAEYEALESLLTDRSRVRKAIYTDLYAAMQAAWTQERARRKLPESTGSGKILTNKRHGSSGASSMHARADAKRKKT